MKLTLAFLSSRFPTWPKIFKQINWLPVNYRFRQCLAANVFKFFDDKCPLYMKDFYEKSCISQAWTRNSTMKLSQPLRRTNNGQHCISFLAPSVWNNLPNKLKHCTVRLKFNIYMLLFLIWVALQYLDLTVMVARAALCKSRYQLSTTLYGTTL